jgi:hypothetical protein
MAGAVRAKIGAVVYPGRFWQLVASLMHMNFGLKKPEVLKQLSAITVILRTDRLQTLDQPL